jgi:hypothetical protein
MAGEQACPSRCVACGRPYAVVHVHGHGQCAHCGVNTEPCCQPDSWPDDQQGPSGVEVACDDEQGPANDRLAPGDSSGPARA